MLLCGLDAKGLSVKEMVVPILMISYGFALKFAGSAFADK